MTQIFVSHSSADAVAAGDLRQRLLEVDPNLTFFLSSESTVGPVAGTSWDSWIRRTLSSSDLVLFLAGATSDSPWCSAELGMARVLDKPILPLTTGPDAVINPIIAHVQARPVERPADELLGLIEGMLGGRSDRQAPPPEFVPYPGLVPLSEEQNFLLFGRDEELERLLDDFARVRNGPARVMMVSGPSGSGKSSLVRAGLLPRLRALEWAIDGPHQARDLIGSHLGSTGQGDEVVVLDQAEELVMMPESERAGVVTALEERLAGGATLLLIARSEFRARIGDWFPKPIDHYISFVGTDAMYEIVRGPAKLAQLAVSEELIDRLVHETGSGDALPLLAYTLHELWLDRDRFEVALKESTLDELGGVRGVLVRRAQQALHAATDGDPRADQQVLSLLVRLASPEYVPPTRTPQRVGSFSDAERAQLDPFREAGLLSYRTSYSVDDRLASTARPTGDHLVDVTHEALFDWPPLAAEIDQQREFNRERVAIERAAEQWDESGREDNTLLLAGPRLAFAHDVSLAERGDLLQTFIEASRHNDREQRRRRLLTRVAIGAGVIAAAAAVFAVVQRNEATDQRDQAEEARTVSQALRVSAQANEAIGEQRDLSMLAAVSAYMIDANAETERTLMNTLATPDGPVHYFSGPEARWTTLRLIDDVVGVVASATLQPATLDLASGALTEFPAPGVEVLEIEAFRDSALAVFRGRRPPAGSVVGLLDPGLGVIDTIEFDGDVRAVDADAGTVAFGDFDGVVHVARVVDGSFEAPASPISSHSTAIVDVAVSPDGSIVASAGADGVIVQWLDGAGNATAEQVLVTTSPGSPTSERLLFHQSDAGLDLIGAGTDTSIKRWRLVGDSFGEPTEIGVHVGNVHALSIDSGGSVLYSAGREGHVQRWDLVLGGIAGPTLLAHGSDVFGLSSGGPGQLLSTDGVSAILWDLDAGRIIDRPGAVPAAWEQESFEALVMGAGPVAAITADGRVLVADGREFAAPDRARKAWWVNAAGDRLVVESGSSQVDLAPLDVWVVSTGGSEVIAEGADAVAVGPCLTAVAAAASISLFDTGGCGEVPAAIDLGPAERGDDIVELAWSGNETRLAVVRQRSGLVEIDLTGAPTGRAADLPPNVTSLAWVNDDLVAVGFDRDGQSVVIDLNDPSERLDLGGHDDAVWWLEVDSPGTEIFSAGQDGLVYVTGVAETQVVGSPLIGVRRARENDREAAVRGLRLLEDEQLLLAIHGDRLAAWELNPDRLIPMACDRAGRTLTAPEKLALDLTPEVYPCE